MSTIYAVTVSYHRESEQVSRIFQSLRAARKWAKWLASMPFASRVRIMAGGQGGMEVL